MMVLGPASWEGLHMQLRETNYHGAPRPYYLVNLRGAKPVHTRPARKLHISPKVYVFLWLLSKNYILIKDNVGHMFGCLVFMASSSKDMEDDASLDI